MSPGQKVSECPECGAGVKVQLDQDHDLTLSELTEENLQQGEYFFCPVCQIAWGANERTPYELPTLSSGPNGFLSDISSGIGISNGTTSNYRLLGYNDDGYMMLRNVGDLAFARDDSPGPPLPRKLENQLGNVVAVKASGYPNAIQNLLNALRPGYCIHATIGESDESGGLEFDAQASCDIVEAVPVDYAVDTEYIPEFAETVWNEDFDPELTDGQIPHARRTLSRDGAPAADVYVFPKNLRDEEGVPLFAGMQRGKTHHLEKFTTNFTGTFTGGVIDVIFIAPTDRPYFAVYCLGGDCLELAHELRAALGLPVVHRGWDADRERVYDIRYNSHFVERTTKEDEDVLVPVADQSGTIYIESGTVEGEYFNARPEPHEIVVTVSDGAQTVEAARLRAPSARINADDTGNDKTPEHTRTAKSASDQASGNPSETSPDTAPETALAETARTRLADIVELQPTSNGELADAWGFLSGSDVYQYISSELDDYYYRDDNNYIRATDRAEELIADTD